MLEMQGTILDTGISVVYTPVNAAPVVDIVVVHGLKGHPFKTWTSGKAPNIPMPSRTSSQPELPGSAANNGQKSALRGMLSRLLHKSSVKTTMEMETDPAQAKLAGSSHGSSPPVFWPADLLPEDCPRSRILVYGYDSKITKYMAGATNKNNVFSHGKDLMFVLARARVLNRPLIFIAHSLGGIIVKEMLARSSVSSEADLQDIVESTAAVIFLGTPHRGSPDLSALGEWARSVLSILRMETTSDILDALGLKTADLERAQEAFSGLWYKYDFRVKTFKEGLGLTGVNLGVLGNKVVPDYSSLLGDQRERAETIQANHMEMCRFTGPDDPNYRKVAGEVRSIYLSLIELNTLRIHKGGRIQHRKSASASSSASDAREPQTNKLSCVEEACLQSLWYPTMHIRRQTIEKPADQTCLWLFKHTKYQDWLNGRNRDETSGLLWIKGKPGTGKSVLMNEAFRQAWQERLKAKNQSAAAFFFNARGDELERTPTGIFRSLLYQLLPESREHIQSFREICETSKIISEDQTSTVQWQEAELRRFFQTLYTQQSTKRTSIFIDGLDECDPGSVRHQAYFWSEITKSAHTAGVHLDVCLSSRHFPFITLSHCPVIVVEDHNNDDITTYVDQKFKLGIAAEEPQWHLLRDKVLGKSAGIFLWVVVVIGDILKNWDEGKGLQYLLKRLDVLPEELESLFSQIFLSLDSEARRTTLKLFQWAILAVKPLRLHEWHHILAFIRQPAPWSLRQWRASDHFTGSDFQLERQIRSISKGLIEVSTMTDQQEAQGFETISVLAKAGSLDLSQGDTRIVQVIHESVREFFLQGKGFSILDPSLEQEAVGNSHLSIMTTCLDYLDISELDALVQARSQIGNRECRPGSTLDSCPLSAPQGLSQWPVDDRMIQARPDPAPRSSCPARTRESRLSHRRAHSPQTGHTINDSDYKKEGRSSSRIHTQGLAEQTAASELLTESLASTPEFDIARWMALSQFVPEQTSMNGSVRTTTTVISFTGRSRILEDNPSLLSYATVEFFSHAHLADECGVNPSPIIDRFNDGKTWARWVALREDIPYGTQLTDYVAHWDLPTWVAACGASELDIALRNPRPKPGAMFMLGGSECSEATSFSSPSDYIGHTYPRNAVPANRSSDKPGLVPQTDQKSDEECTEYVGEIAIDDDEDSSDWEDSVEDSGEDVDIVRPRRQRSVASFGSAGSHVGILSPRRRAHRSGNDESIREGSLKRVNSDPTLSSRRPLLASMNQDRRRTEAQSDSMRSKSAEIEDPRHSTRESRRRGSDGASLRQTSGVTCSVARPILKTSRALSPRTIRRNMLATELTESLRCHLLWERRTKQLRPPVAPQRRLSFSYVEDQMQNSREAHRRDNTVAGDREEVFDLHDNYFAKGW